MSTTRILIVEDELIVAADLHQRLSLLGYTIAGSASRGEQAVALAGRLRPDLVLMDIHLEGPMDGIDAAGQIRLRYRLPVVFLTAYSEDATLERAKTAEPYGYILKPFEEREIKTIVEMALFKHKADDQILRLERLYATLSQVNQAIVRIKSREELFSVIGRIAIEFGRFAAARIDTYDAVTQTLAPWELAGEDLGSPFLGADVALAAIHTEKTGVCNDMAAESPLQADRASAAKLDIRSFAAVPVRFQGQICGVLSLAAYELGFFQEQEIKLIQEMAMDISFALDQFEAVARRLRAETALEKERTFLRRVIDAVPGFICVKNHEGRFLVANQALADSYGANVASVEGRLEADLNPNAGQVSRFQRDDLEVLATRQPKLVPQEQVTFADGQTHWLSTVKVPLVDETGACSQLLVVATNITARKTAEADREKLQAQLVQAQKMESVGRLAGGVAHEFNNMLQAILGNVSLALETTPLPSQIQENLEEIKRAAQRSADLTRQLLAFARRQTIVPRTLDLNQAVSGMLKLLQRLIGEDIQMHWEPGPGLWPVKMDPSQIDQLLANLTVNARDAIGGPGGKGRITLETANAALDRAGALSLTEGAPGDYVMLAVSDTGAGMDAETRAHLFEPFFTTKEVGEGTGLGLATVYGIVKQNGGFIQVDSELGRGATFKIFLPRSAAQPEPPAATNPQQMGRSGETVLMVEDEEQILSLGGRILRQQGYRVLTARLPAEALELVKQHSGPIHLLVTDVVMPGMNGRELRDRVAALKPGLRCLFMSGYTADVIAHHGALDEGVRFLQKPFTIQALTRGVREVLDQAPGANKE